MLQAASQTHGFTHVIECLVRQAEQPFDEAAVSQGADAGIMASLLELMRDVLNRIVEGEASFCEVTTSGELGDEVQRRPSGVVSLESSTRIGAAVGHG